MLRIGARSRLYEPTSIRRLAAAEFVGGADGEQDEEGVDRAKHAGECNVFLQQLTDLSKVLLSHAFEALNICHVLEGQMPQFVLEVLEHKELGGEDAAERHRCGDDAGEGTVVVIMAHGHADPGCAAESPGDIADLVARRDDDAHPHGSADYRTDEAEHGALQQGGCRRLGSLGGGGVDGFVFG